MKLGSRSTSRKKSSKSSTSRNDGTELTSRGSSPSPLIPPTLPRSDRPTGETGGRSGGSPSPLIPLTLPRSDPPTGETGGGSVQGTVEERREARGFHNQNCCKFCREIVATDVKFGCTVLKNWFAKLEDEEIWLENIRGYLGTLAGLITAMSFAAALAPPGGVVSASIADSIEDAKRSVAELAKNTTKNTTIPGGEALLSFIDPGEFNQFLFWNSLCMYLSLVTFLMMMSGIPLKHCLLVWLCSALMCADVFALGSLFSGVVSLTTPRVGGVWARDAKIRKGLKYGWMRALALVLVVLTVKLLYWFVMRFSKKTITDEEVGGGAATGDAAGGDGAART